MNLADELQRKTPRKTITGRIERPLGPDFKDKEINRVNAARRMEIRLLKSRGLNKAEIRRQTGYSDWLVRDALKGQL